MTSVFAPYACSQENHLPEPDCGAAVNDQDRMVLAGADEGTINYQIIYQYHKYHASFVLFRRQT